MNALAIENMTGIEGLKVLQRDVPKKLSPRQVLIKMRAGSINFRDLLVLNGMYNPQLKLPHIPGSDGVGTVEQTGSEVSRVKRGDRVVGTFASRWLSGELTAEKMGPTLGGEIDGVFAEYIVLDEEAAVQVPAHLSDEEAATLPCAALTAWSALFTGAEPLGPGHSVLVQGTGNIALFAIQFAALAGARVIVTSSSDEKLARATALGATDTINYQRTPEWDKQVLDLTNGRGVDQIIEIGGGKTLAQSLGATRVGGRINVIGILSGAIAEIPILPILLKKISIQGAFVGSRDSFEAMNRAITLHKLKPVIAGVFSFEQAKDAFRYKQTGSDFGKVVIRLC